MAELPMFAMAGSMVSLATAGATLMYSFIKGGGLNESEGDAAIAELQEATGVPPELSGTEGGVEGDPTLEDPDPGEGAGEGDGEGDEEGNGDEQQQQPIAGVQQAPFAPYMSKPLVFVQLGFLGEHPIAPAPKPEEPSAPPAPPAQDPPQGTGDGEGQGKTNAGTEDTSQTGANGTGASGPADPGTKAQGPAEPTPKAQGGGQRKHKHRHKHAHVHSTRNTSMKPPRSLSQIAYSIYRRRAKMAADAQ